MNKFSKIALAAVVFGVLAGCGSDDVEDFFVDNAGIDVNDDGEATTAAEMVVKSLELIAQAALVCGDNPGCGTGEYDHVVSGLSGELKVVATPNTSTGTVNYVVTSTDTFVDIDSGGMKFQVDLKTQSSMSLEQQVLSSGTSTVWQVSMGPSNFIADQPDDALFYGQTKDNFHFDNGTGMLVDNMGSGILTGKDDKTREFTYTTGGNVNLK
ncbi:hypothetical protein LZP69_12615 [Shewanella sp. AS1]|uniref:hypothetical protein n=1 Tax=Shewanella sp. AS1 TaxID=2907626 RepID=UPI001F2B6689|nr:hypothetical protein [Shewanella sp. AS1]MCE9680007.1 hypothetical protein [Shewanella sp. AS1]